MPVPPATVLAFARATLATGTVTLLDEDNRPAGRVQIADAVWTGQAFMGDVLDGRIVLDVDTDRDGQVWAPVAGAALTAAGCNRVIVTSGTPGSEHHWYVAPVGHDAASIRELAVAAGVPAGQIRWRGADCRPPLSPHRLGHPVRLITPATESDALGLLQRRPGQVPFNADRWTGVLADGKDEQYGGRPHRVAQALATAVVNAGETREYFEAVANGSAFLSAHLAKQSLREQEAWMAARWNAAVKWVRGRPMRDEFDRAIGAARRQWMSDRWSGRASQTDRAVYGALITAAEMRKSVQDISASQRWLAEQTGCARSTVIAALGRLRHAGLIESARAPSDRPGRRDPDTFRLIFDAQMSGATPLPAADDRQFDVVPDLFRGRRGPPRGAYETWRAVPSDSWATVAEIAARRGGGLAVTTVRSHLHHLQTYSLAERNVPAGHQWRRFHADPARLAALAREAGVHGHLARQREYHRREREVRATTLRNPEAA